MKTFCVHNHQGKANVLIEALNNRGWSQKYRHEGCSFMLTDLDHSSFQKRLKNFSETNRPIFMYQHAARPNIFPDFPGYEPYEFTTAAFVTAQGHIELSRIIGVNYPIEVVGWYFCPVREFQKRETAKNILFAPVHPNADNSLPHIYQALNRNVFNALLVLQEEGAINLTVRYIRDFFSNGLWEAPGVQYEKGQLQHSCFDFDKYDVIVSSQTFAYKCISIGLPTIMMGEDIPPRIGNQAKGTFHIAKSFDKYSHLLKYPYDILSSYDTISLLNRAIKDDCDILDWKQRLIGEKFNPNYFVDRIESYL